MLPDGCKETGRWRTTGSSCCEDFDGERTPSSAIIRHEAGPPSELGHQWLIFFLWVYTFNQYNVWLMIDICYNNLRDIHMVNWGYKATYCWVD